MIPIKLSRDAANYIRNESEYLRQRNLVAARNFSLAIKDAKRMLQSFPDSGNHMHGLQIVGSRTLVTGDYLLDYSYDGSQIEVTSIRHGRMLMPTPDVEIDDDLEEGLDNVSVDSNPTL
ncbi:type II toxin-antitoxin system RelE/ParE family toxin [Pararhizobium sp. LjRoot238]|uniref:type II toxin-antitoxin system RelE/ParE family toxin n=1 Tax=Pararhizobium sp. LjRoot238 TaxID=3342293 RepID=UPI003ECEA8F8